MYFARDHKNCSLQFNRYPWNFYVKLNFIEQRWKLHTFLPMTIPTYFVHFLVNLLIIIKILLETNKLINLSNSNKIYWHHQHFDSMLICFCLLSPMQMQRNIAFKLGLPILIIICFFPQLEQNHFPFSCNSPSANSLALYQIGYSKEF